MCKEVCEKKKVWFGKSLDRKEKKKKERKKKNWNLKVKKKKEKIKEEQLLKRAKE